MAALSTEAIEASCVAADGRGVLIEGRDGDARTDLALRMIDRGAVLVADTQTVCLRQDRRLLAGAPAGTAGRIEVRGLGIVGMPHAERVPVELLIVLLDAAPRFPDDKRTRSIAGVEVPVLALAASDHAAPIKAELWLRIR
ncbi:MAG: aldolase [Sphingomonas sp.]|uniref:HPr kinase/phosphorylase n=1 Tax=Sphingomonas sp. TaxID=28214 RepID=UPI0025EB4A66|nr:aldolase [Sphingomonas sp.]MBX3564750.1 aldolase [Sphingomonas sp.]